MWYFPLLNEQDYLNGIKEGLKSAKVRSHAMSAHPFNPGTYNPSGRGA